jgi:hypothetical protein
LGSLQAALYPASAKEETMTRLSYLFFCATFVAGVSLVGCGGGGGGGSGGSGGGGNGGTTTVSFLDLVPRDGTIPGWTVDPSISKTAGQVAATATTEKDVTDLIDGAAADFFAAPYTPQNFAWQNYVNASLPSPMGATTGSTMKLYIMQMPSGQPCTLYTSLLKVALYSTNTWTDPTSPAIGTKSRITDSGTDWWINFCTGNYYVEARLSPSYGPAPDYAIGDATQKQAAMDYAVAVASKM